jgi:4-amino-4-deoxy-L-arabinose transferase-like glycosyltransferase
MIDVLVAVIVAAVLNLIVLARIQRRDDAEEARFLARVYTRTLLLRYMLAVFLYVNLDAAGVAGVSSFAYTFWGDSSTYDMGGWLLARSWQGDVVVNPYLNRQHGSGIGFIHLVGTLYFLFGRNQLLVQLVNGTIGSLTVLVIYAIGARLFDKASARWAALFMAFFPQMIFWSSAMYKDPSVMLGIASAMYGVIRLHQRFTLRHLALFVSACLALLTLRFYIFYIVAFATLGTFLFGQRRAAFRKLAVQVIVALAFLAAFSFAARRETVERQKQYFDLRQVQIARLDQAQLGRSAIDLEADVSTPAGALAALPRGLVYLMFAPFPWSVTGLRQLLTLPETLVWYALMPAFARGLRYTLRHRLRPCLPILVFAGMLTVAYALFQGNVGTAYRQRTQITMFFFVFMGVGLVQRQEQRRRRALGALQPLPP